MKRWMAFGLTLSLLLVICPPGSVCAASSGGENACPMAAMTTSSAEAPCHGTSLTRDDICCCSMKERAPVPLPVMPEGAAAALVAPVAPAVSMAILPPPIGARQGRQAARTLPRPPKIDLFLHNSAFLL